MQRPNHWLLTQTFKIRTCQPAFLTPCRQADSAGLVAVVAAVVDTVRPIHAGEKLEQETCLIGTASAEVPKGLLGRKALQFIDDPIDCLGPLDRAVVFLALPVDQRLNQPATRLEFPG